MDTFKKFTNHLYTFSFFLIIINSLMIVGVFLLFRNVIKLNETISLIATSLLTIFLSIGVSKLIVRGVTEPFEAVWQALWQSTESAQSIPAPQPDKLNHGRQLATDMIQQIYKLGDAPIVAALTPVAIRPTPAGQAVAATVTMPVASPVLAPPIDILELLPLPVIALDASDHIVLINQIGAQYLGRTKDEIIGTSINDILQLSFQTKDTLESWLVSAKTNSVTSSSSWDRVRIQLPDEKGLRQFDLVAHYSKDNIANYETLLALFDHTERYGNEDGSTSYVALAVHELRTPLTVLRGYIEVFEDELDGQLTPELRDFMHKMSASAQTLTAFVSNILNVARVDENQLTLSLYEANWNELLPEISKDIELRARVRGKTIELDIQPNLPTVAVDKVSMYEVVSNLVDNAIKYSGESTKIIIHSQVGKDASVETVVQDFGLGIPASSLKYLYTKFYRSHRSRGSVSGSGLGLYLVKAIITAHGGNVWVNSKKNEGSSFGFSLQPYANVAAELNDTTGTSIERQAHGWIKNHSMYRR